MNNPIDRHITNLHIHGMTCNHCIDAVTKALLKVDGVAEAHVQLPGQAIVKWSHSPSASELSAIQNFVALAGYQAEIAKDTTYLSNTEANDTRNDLLESSSQQFNLAELGNKTGSFTSGPHFPSLNIITESPKPSAKPGLPTLTVLPEGSPAPSQSTRVQNTAPQQNTPTGVESWELTVSGMHCASCVGRVEKALQNSAGVNSAVVNLATERASILVDPDKAKLDQIRMNVRRVGYDIVKRDRNISPSDQADAMRRERYERIRGWKHRLLAGFIFGLPLILFAHGRGHMVAMPLAMRLVMIALAVVTTLVVGLPYFKSAWTLLKHGSTNMDTLVSLGSLVALGYGSWMTFVPEHPEPHFLADGVIILIMITLGKWLESRSKGSAADALESLMDLTPRRVMAVRESGREIEIDQQDLRVGMLFRIRPGEAVATDGEVVEGSANVDEAMLTGESNPIHKTTNARVIGGSRCLDGTLLVRATQVGSETVLENIVNAVRRAQSSKASVQTTVDKIAAVFVPGVIGIALVTLLFWGLLLHRWPEGVMASAAVLLISCPCALGLATPMAISVGSARAAKLGFIVHDAGVFERCDQLNYCMFDKTGTLTEGTPEVVDVFPSPDTDRAECLRIAATLESFSEHPLARAIVSAAGAGLNTATVTDFLNDRGHGVSGRIQGKPAKVGSIKWLERMGIEVSSQFTDYLRQSFELPRSLVGVALDNQLIGIIALQDKIRPTAESAVDKLLVMGLNVGVISGDRFSAVRPLAEKLNIPLDDIYAEMTPEEKSAVLDRLRVNKTHVAMVGDGLNDAPALASADVSLALASGTDVAKNAADIVIVGSDLNIVPKAIALSRATLRTIRQNLFWAFAYNVIAIPLAAFGMFASNGPLIASVAMALSSLTVVARSALLARIRI